MEGVGQRKKVTQMMECLAKAMFQLDRRFLSSDGIVVSLQRDEKNATIQLEFAGCDKDLKVRTGMIGMAENKTGPLAITQNTKQIIEKCWSAAGELDAHGYDRFRSSVELINIDSAADEVLAAKEEHQPSLPLLAPLLPNCKYVVRDKSHGSQRTLEPFSTTVGWLGSCLADWRVGRGW